MTDTLHSQQIVDRRDIRDSDLYREAEELFAGLLRPGTGQISDAAEIHVAPNGKRAVFSGTMMDKLEGPTPTRICQVELPSGSIRVLSVGPNCDRLPRFSSDGRQVAFLSDRDAAGDFQLYLLDPVSGAARPTPRLEGWVEYLQWSPDGQRILLGVAGHGADMSGSQGAMTSRQRVDVKPTWMPTVENGKEDFRWRRVWVYELTADKVYPVSGPSDNVWEATWCGNSALAVVRSQGPEEGLWYSASLHTIDIPSQLSREIFTPHSQLGLPAASPSGKRLAVVEAICSDRWFVAGDLRLIDVENSQVRTVPTRGVDVSHLEWRSEDRLLLAGHRGFETVVGIYDVSSDTFTEMWASREISGVGRHVTVAGIGDRGDCALIAEGFKLAPEIALIREGRYTAVQSFDLGYAVRVESIAAIECVNWKAPDSLDIQGWLLKPKGEGPFPTVMIVHGGPVWLWHSFWLGRGRYIPLCMLLRRGYAIFFPNPRGSSGRGQEFARRVVGDMGGADTFDCLSGLDELVARGIADPSRLGVTGVSYGGFMTCWLITQDPRFGAAVPICAHTNQITEHLLSNIPQFMDLFLADQYDNPEGKYISRSPVMYARNAKTPTLNICGALDRCTPPEEAAQFHNALLENGVESVLVTYPEEGHGMRNFPATIDYAARMVAWFQKYIGAESEARR